MMGRIFETMRWELTGRCRKVHNEELHSLNTSLNIIRALKLKMRRAWHAVRLGVTRNACRIVSVYLKGRGCLEDLNLDGRTALKWVNLTD
jgi:hypothetical protein